MIAWKTSCGCAHSAVKMTKWSLTILLKQNFSYDYIVRTVRGDTTELLDDVNILHPIPKFILETTEGKKQYALSGHAN